MSGTVTINGRGVKGTIKKKVSPFNEYEIEVGVPTPITDYGKYNMTITVLDGYKLISAEIYSKDYDSWNPMTINDEKTIATYWNSITITNNSETIYRVEVEGGESAPETSFLSFNNLYLIDYKILESISKEDLMISWGLPDSPNTVDLRNFIINVLEFNFSVNEEMVGEESEIKLGNYSLKTVATTLKVDNLTLDLGVIKVPEKYFNSFDYLNTNVTINLPFLESIELEKEYVIGYEISVKYNIDLFNGYSTIMIVSSKTNKIIYSSNFILGRNIPFSTTSNNVASSISEVRGLRNNIKTPYIEVVRNVVPELDKFNNTVTKQGTLENVKGYISINEIDLKVETTSSEKSSIISILKQGVNIK